MYFKLFEVKRLLRPLCGLLGTNSKQLTYVNPSVGVIGWLTFLHSQLTWWLLQVCTWSTSRSSGWSNGVTVTSGSSIESIIKKIYWMMILSARRSGDNLEQGKCGGSRRGDPRGIWGRRKRGAQDARCIWLETCATTVNNKPKLQGQPSGNTKDLSKEHLAAPVDKEPVFTAPPLGPRPGQWTVLVFLDNCILVSSTFPGIWSSSAPSAVPGKALF